MAKNSHKMYKMLASKMIAKLYVCIFFIIIILTEPILDFYAITTAMDSRLASS